MANRKKPHIAPVQDNSAFATEYAAEQARQNAALVDDAFQAVVRRIHDADRATVLALRNDTFSTLRRLGVPRDTSRAVGYPSDASRNCDDGSFRVWLSGLTSADAEAISQLVALDATCVARSS